MGDRAAFNLILQLFPEGREASQQDEKTDCNEHK